MNIVCFCTVNKMAITDKGVTFSPNHVLKHLKPGKKLDSFHYRAYHTKRLCVVDCLKEYLKRCSTKVQTDTKALFTTYGKPFRAVAIGSMRRWVKDLFIETSILKEYTPYSCRSAATSKASQLNIDIVEIFYRAVGKMSKRSLIFIHCILCTRRCRLHEYFNMLSISMSIFIYDVYFYLYACKTKWIYIHSAHLICLTC